MADLRIVVAGASGRMGRNLIRAVTETAGCILSGALVSPGNACLGEDAGRLAGLGAIGVVLSDDPLTLIASADALIDFTKAQVSVALAALSAQARIVHVIGTTGFSAEDDKKIAAASRHAPIVKSGNMSLGVTLLAALVRQAARALPDFDVEILEMHHRHKADAPSGTALLLGEAAAEGRGTTLARERIRPHLGADAAREDGHIGFASLRGGTVVGEHQVIMAGSHERIVLSHVAEDRMIFARGAVAAAQWGRDKKPGLYAMADVLGIA